MDTEAKKALEQAKVTILDHKREIGNLKVKLLDASQIIERLEGMVKSRDEQIDRLRINHVDDERLVTILQELADHYEAGVRLRRQAKSLAQQCFENTYIGE